MPQINRKNAIHVSSKKAYRNKSALPWDRADQQSTFPKAGIDFRRIGNELPILSIS
jgi:hypothetical protein